MVRRKRTVPGLITNIGKTLRIKNGDIESLRRLRKPGRPRKLENILNNDNLPSTPIFPGKDDLRDSHVRDGFRLVRHRTRRDQITENNQSLQVKFDSLCSEVKMVDEFSWEYAEIEDRMKNGKSRKDNPVPASFCSCANEIKNEGMPCLIHGLKQDDCACGGINGITGYRTCEGHRATGHIPGMLPFTTDRMKEAAGRADQHAREIGWL